MLNFQQISNQVSDLKSNIDNRTFQKRHQLTSKARESGFTISFEILPIAGERIAYSTQKLVGEKYRFCVQHWDPYLKQKITLVKEILETELKEPVFLSVPGHENTILALDSQGTLSVNILEHYADIFFNMQGDSAQVSEIRREGKIHIQSDNAKTLNLIRVHSLQNVGIEASQINYAESSFCVRGELSILLHRSQNIIKPLLSPGAVNITFSKEARDPIYILADIRVGDAQVYDKKKDVMAARDFCLYSSQPIILGSAQKFIIIQANGTIKIYSSFINSIALDLINASIRSSQDIFLDAPRMKLGRFAKGKTPSSILSSGKTTLVANQKLEMEELHIYSQDKLTVISPNPVDNLATDISVANAAEFDTPKFILRHAFLDTGSARYITSNPAKMRIAKDLTITGEIEMEGSCELSCQRVGAMVNRVWKDKRPLCKGITEYHTVTRERMITRYRKGDFFGIKHSPYLANETYQTVEYGRIHAPVISIASNILIESRNIEIFGVLSVIAASINNFDRLHIGRQAALLVQPAVHFKANYPLFEKMSINPMFEPSFEHSHFMMRPVIPIPLSRSEDLSQIFVLIKGRLQPYNERIPILSHPLQEEKEVIDILMHAVGHAFIDENTRTPTAVLEALKRNAKQHYMQGLSIQDIQEPILFYKEMTYCSKAGQEYPVLSPILSLPKSWDHSKDINSGAYFYALQGINIQGDPSHSTLTLTGSIGSEGRVVVRDIHQMIIQKQKFQQTNRHANTYRKDYIIGSKVCHNLVDITTQTPLDGGELKAEFIQLENIKAISIAGAKLMGYEGIMGEGIGIIHVSPLIISEVKNYNHSANNDWIFKEATETLLRHEIVPATLFSPEGAVTLSATAQYLNSLACGARSITLTATNDLQFLSTVVQEEMPTQYTRKGMRFFTSQGQYETGQSASLQALENVKCVAKGNMYLIGTEMMAYSIELKADKGIEVIPLILKQWFQTISHGFRGLYYYSRRRNQQHESGVVPSFSAQKNIKLSTKDNNLILVAPQLLAGESIELAAPNGSIILQSAVFHQDVSCSELSVGLSFMGSQVVEAAMRRDFRQAALSMLKEFPLLACIEQLCAAKNKDMADNTANSIKTLYHVYRTYKHFSKCANLKEFAQSQFDANIKIRFGIQESKNAWTELALPWLQAKNISLQSKNFVSKGSQVTCENLTVTVEHDMSIEAAEQQAMSDMISAAIIPGYNFSNNCPNLGIEIENSKQRSVAYIISRFNVSGVTTLVAGGKISLAAVCIETLKAVLVAEKMELKTLQDETHGSYYHANISSEGSIGASIGQCDKKFAKEQAKIQAKESLFMSIEKEIKMLGSLLLVGKQAKVIQATLPDGKLISLYDVELPKQEGLLKVFQLNFDKILKRLQVLQFTQITADLQMQFAIDLWKNTLPEFLQSDRTLCWKKLLTENAQNWQTVIKEIAETVSIRSLTQYFIHKLNALDILHETDMNIQPSFWGANEAILKEVHETNEKTKILSHNAKILTILSKLSNINMRIWIQTAEYHPIPMPDLASKSIIPTPPTAAQATPPQSNAKKKTPALSMLLKTVGEGDCAYHAIFGQWCHQKQKIFCADVNNKRKMTADVIRNLKEQNPILPLVVVAIQEMLDGGTHLFWTLREEYKKNMNHDEKLSHEAWVKLEAALKSNKDISDYIASGAQGNSSLKNFKAQFKHCLNLNDGLLYGLVRSMEPLNTLFVEYNRATHIAFDLAKRVLQDKNILAEYADYIQKPGQYLLPHEISIIAHIFNINVQFITYNKNRKIFSEMESLNPQGNPSVGVCFNGSNHFERIHEDYTQNFSNAVSNSAGVLNKQYSIDSKHEAEIKVQMNAKEMNHNRLSAEIKEHIALKMISERVQLFWTVTLDPKAEILDLKFSTQEKCWSLLNEQPGFVRAAAIEGQDVLDSETNIQIGMNLSSPIMDIGRDNHADFMAGLADIDLQYKENARINRATLAGPITLKVGSISGINRELSQAQQTTWDDQTHLRLFTPLCNRKLFAQDIHDVFTSAPNMFSNQQQGSKYVQYHHNNHNQGQNQKPYFFQTEIYRSCKEKVPIYSLNT